MLKRLMLIAGIADQFYECSYTSICFAARPGTSLPAVYLEYRKERITVRAKLQQLGMYEQSYTSCRFLRQNKI